MGRTEIVAKARYSVYLNRAAEFEEQMARAASDHAWNSVGLLGVHCVISACDALTVRMAGQRWSGPDPAGVHGVVSALNLPGAGVALRHITHVLDQRTRVEYESRAFSREEAVEVGRSASLLLKWVRSQLA
jgi:hypothetical protein